MSTHVGFIKKTLARQYYNKKAIVSVSHRQNPYFFNEMFKHFFSGTMQHLTFSTIAFFFFCVSSLSLHAQNTATDSLQAYRLWQEADSLLAVFQYDSANKRYAAADSVFERLGMQQQQIELADHRALCLSRSGDNLKAMGIIDEALEQALKLEGETSLLSASCYHRKGYLHNRQYDHQKALDNYQKAFEIRTVLLPDTATQIADSYNNIGVVYADMGQYHKALDYLEKALAIYQQTENMRSSVADVYNNIGIIYFSLGEYDLTIENHLQSLHYKQEAEQETADVPQTYNYLGKAFLQKGEYNLSLEYFTKALLLGQKMFSEYHPFIANSYYNIANVYLHKADLTMAYEYAARASQLRRVLHGEESPEVAESLEQIALIYAGEEKFAKAEENIQKVITLNSLMYSGEHPVLIGTYIHAGDIYEMQKKYGYAFDYYQKALQMQQQIFGRKHPVTAVAYNKLGHIFALRENYTDALNHYQKALIANLRHFNDTVVYAQAVLVQYFDHNVLLKTLELKANALLNRYHQTENTKDLRMAFETVQQCYHLLNKIRRSHQSQSDKIELAQTATDVYEQAIVVSYEMYRHYKKDTYLNQAFSASERNKGGVLLGSLVEIEAQKIAGIPDSLLQIERHLKAEIATFQKELAEANDSITAAFLNNKLFAANREYDSLIGQFENNFMRYFKHKYSTQTVPVDELQAILDRKTAVRTYFKGDSTIYVFTITRRKVDLQIVPLRDYFDMFVEMLRDGIVSSVGKPDPVTYRKLGYEFYEILFPEEMLKNRIENLIIIPDGTLGMLPYEALLTQEVPDASLPLKDYPFLLKKYNISYAYSSNLFYKNATKILEQQEGEARCLAMAPVFADEMQPLAATDERRRLAGVASLNLPATEEEVAAISTVFQDNSETAQTITHQQASEHFVKGSQLSGYRYVHIATHGFVNTETPELSGILLAKDDHSSEDGVLYLGEIYNLQLQSNMVVLSACETGLGQITEGEGVIGLSRAFLYAGTKNLVVSLWKVADESTSELMIDFYDIFLSQLFENEEENAIFRYAPSLRSAKMKMIENGVYAHPYYWSPFILIGW